jgi:hypothetical protein
MDFIYTELSVRAQVALPSIAYWALPNLVSADTCKKLHPSSDLWDTSASNNVQVRNILESYATILFLASDIEAIRTLISTIIELGARPEMKVPGLLDRHRQHGDWYADCSIWKIEYVENPPKWE